jgi:hypothetical protein
MFQLFSNHSSTSKSDQSGSRVDDHVLDEEDALSGEHHATYDEMLPWLLLGAAVGY